MTQPDHRIFMKHFLAAEAVLKAYLYSATGDMNAADELLGELASTGGEGSGGFFEPSSFSRLSRYQPASGRPPGGIQLDANAGTIPNSVVDSCFALANADEKFAVFELRDRAAILVAEWVEVLPAGR